MNILHNSAEPHHLNTNMFRRAPAVPARPPVQKKLLHLPHKMQIDNKHGSTEAGEDDLLLLSDDDEQVQHIAPPSVT